MGEMVDFCAHLDSIGEVTKEDLILKSKGTCESCGAGGPNLWACLQDGCQYVGCGESYADHSTLHAQAKKHNLIVNLTTFRVWCYSCEKEVFLDSGTPSPTHSHSTSPRLSHRDVPSATHSLKSVPIAVADYGESESDEDDLKPRDVNKKKKQKKSRKIIKWRKIGS
ncbi:hypothetical protein AB205_0113830 [Aquarana catesbeiana]|uniref:UBP-type domain-containing protein n=1 Tax=Aquarana catesbeiana TaxID=8400 RepID=A0A2G9Q0C2_AQUCT|nr:hypothetical protein AB205_0113830 [Aquarana catesbeiana]